jgi:uncharacterized Tic20 family protein
VTWQLKKDELPGIDAHARDAVNWIISVMLYAAMSELRVFVISMRLICAGRGLAPLFCPGSG